jgi:nucleoside-diphosphate-sugar epimerase
MRIVVTGGSGIIGRHVVQHLAGQGHDLLNLDLARPPKDAPGEFQHTELARRDVLEPRLDAFGPEACVHLAELRHAGADLEERVYARNAEATGTLLRTLADLGVARIAYASSCQVYGCFGPQPKDAPASTVAPLKLPLDESEPPRPTNAYGAQKVGAELFLGAMCRRKGLHGVALRLPATHEREHLLRRGRWKQYLAERHPEALQGQGGFGKWIKTNELAAWLDVEDAAKAFEASVAWDGTPPWASESNTAHSGGTFAAFNVADDKVAWTPEDETTPVAELLREEIPHFPPLPTDWPARKCPLSSEAFRRATGWHSTGGVAS